MTTSPSSDESDALRREAMAWFVRRSGGTWSAEDEADWARWQAADPRHAAMFAQCERRWAQLDAVPPDLVSRLRSGLPPPAPAPGRQLPRRAVLRSAAAFAAVAAVTAGVGIAMWQADLGQPGEVARYETGRGEFKHVTLSDGTSLRLDTATRVEVAYYRRHRDVRLVAGQAFFEVVHAPQRPFRVHAGNVLATDVGTAFSVRYTPDIPGLDGVRVAVASGHVRVARLAADGGEEAGSAVLLGPGWQVACGTDGRIGPALRLAQSEIAPWRNERVSFVDLPLAAALAEIDRYGASGLVVRDPRVARLRITGTFSPADQAAIGRALVRVLPVGLVPRDGRTEIVLR